MQVSSLDSDGPQKNMHEMGNDLGYLPLEDGDDCHIEQGSMFNGLQKNFQEVGGYLGRRHREIALNRERSTIS